MLTPVSFAYSVLLIGALHKTAVWLVPGPPSFVETCGLEYVYDGDTVSLNCGGSIETARLVGFDTPETTSPNCEAEAAHGQLATDRLRQIARAGDVRFEGSARDKYGRLLVSMEVDGVDVGETLISEGLALEYTGGSRVSWCDWLG